MNERQEDELHGTMPSVLGPPSLFHSHYFRESYHPPILNPEKHPTVCAATALQRQSLLCRGDGTVIDGSAVSAGNVSVGRVVGVEPGKQLEGAGGVAPVAHEVEGDGEEGDDLDAGGGHAVVGDVADELGGGARGLNVGPDGVALGAER